MPRFLKAPAVCHQVFHDLPVHKRLAAKEVNLQIDSVSGISHEEIKCLAPDLIAHQSTSAVIFPFLRKTIPACQITVMGDMQTQCLDHRLPVLKVKNVILVNVLREKASLLLKRKDFFHSLTKLSLRIRKLCRCGRCQF